MSSTGFRKALILSCCAVLAVSLAAAQDLQYRWTRLPPIDSLTAPVLSAHPATTDGNLYAVATAYSRLVATTSTTGPDGWTPWTILGPEPCSPWPCIDPSFRADPDTSPVVVTDGTTLYVFARGDDDNLHVIRKAGTSDWDSDWQQITYDGRVRGPLSIAVTRMNPVAAPIFHVLYGMTDLRVELRRFTTTWIEVTVPKVWLGFAEGTIASDGAQQLVVALRGGEPFLLFETQAEPWGSPWQRLGHFEAPGAEASIHDISNLARFGNEYHLAFSYRFLCDDVSPVYCHELAHLVLPGGALPIASLRTIAIDPPSSGRQALSELAVYRNKLVTAWTDSSGEVRFARLDTADPDMPWVGGEIVHAGHPTDHAPSLAAFDRRPFLTSSDYGDANFGNDLFAAISRSTDDSVLSINLSRAAILRDATAQLTFWESNELAGGPCFKTPTDADEIVDPSSDGRPVYTEIGFDLWMLPDWLSSHVFHDAGERGCEANLPSGRFYPPCSEAKYPVIIRPVDAIFICDGVWIGRSNHYLRIWEEFGHTLAGMLGFHDDGTLPGQRDADETGIPLADLTAGHALFGESLGTGCVLGTDPDPPNAGRCRGFTGYGGNYDATSRQHAFMYVLYYYVGDGDALREWIERDATVGVDLLSRKYAWIRDAIYHGVEFHRHSRVRDRWNVDCYPITDLACGSSITGTNVGADDRVDGYPCNTYPYSGPEATYRFRTPVPARVTVEMIDLAADLDLMLLPAEAAACDSRNCMLSSTAGGTADETLVFEAEPGVPYHLVADGYSGATSGFTLRVSCETTPPGAIPVDVAALQMDLASGGAELELWWGAACENPGTDYAVYVGEIGAWGQHEPIVCSTDRVPNVHLPAPDGDVYFLVAAHDGAYEGSHGTRSGNVERAPGLTSCTGAEDLRPCP